MKTINAQIFLITLLLGLNSWAQFEPFLYSYQGREHQVQFAGEFLTRFESLKEVQELSAYEKEDFIKYEIEPTLKYLFGPLTHRSLAGMKEHLNISPLWENAFEKNNSVYLPYAYQGVWLLDKNISQVGYADIPLPYNQGMLRSEQWKSCTDSDPEHQTLSFYWYFWDPSRPGCDHKEGAHYQTTRVHLHEMTLNQPRSYPEYHRLIQTRGINNNLQMTFAFGYVKDQNNPNPFQDDDLGAQEFRQFLRFLKKELPQGLIESPIRLQEYQNFTSSRAIGTRFLGKIDGVRTEIKVVINAGIDQMELFAKSFAHDHDSYFAWMGHSRVGSGFDAYRFEYMLSQNPEYYSISNNYQLIYWGGCNSYSYYTLPFFKFKAGASLGTDPLGTKNLDIIANALPSYFIINAENALVQLKALLKFSEPTSYQDIIKDTELIAQDWGINVLVVVLGDEDNDEP